MNLQKVKERVSKYKEEIDEAEERELKAKTAFVEAESRVEKTLDEVDGLKRRLVLLQKDLDGTNDRLAKAEDKLDDVQGRSHDDDSLRQEYEVTELERDETLLQLEDDILKAKKIRDEAHHTLVESERKLVIVEKDLQRTTERLDNAVTNVERLEARISDVGGEIRGLEDRDYEAAEREKLSSEKLEFLNDQLRMSVEHYESNERESRKLEELTAALRHEISVWRGKIESVQDESRRIENLADENLFDHGGAVNIAPPKRRFEPEREYQPDEDKPDEEAQPDTEEDEAPPEDDEEETQPDNENEPDEAGSEDGD